MRETDDDPADFGGIGRLRTALEHTLKAAGLAATVAAGLGLWRLILGYGIARQVAAGDRLSVAFLCLWLLAAYALVAGRLAVRLDRGLDRVRPAGRALGAALAGSLWIALWAGQTVWITSIGTQLADGDVLEAGLRIAALAAPLVVGAGVWLRLGAPLPTGRDVTA